MQATTSYPSEVSTTDEDDKYFTVGKQSLGDFYLPDDEELGLIRTRKSVDFLGQKPRLDYELISGGGKYTHKFQILQVTIRLPESDSVALMAIGYGFVIYTIPIAAALIMLLYPESFVNWIFFLKYCTLMLCCTITLNELILKPRIKSPRPRESANVKPDGDPKPGMPSGHAVNSCAVLTLIIYEITRIPAHLAVSKCAWIFLACAMLAPIPWSRCHNKDHTPEQCAVGAVIGIFAGILFGLLRSQFFDTSVIY